MKKHSGSAWKYLRISGISLLLGLLIGAAVIAVLGKNPFTAYYNLLQGCGFLEKEKYAGGRSQLSDLSSFIDYLTPMILAALSVAVAMKAGLFNIGISGQMLTAAFTATVLVGYSPLPAGIAKPLVLLIGAAAGGAAGALIGYLKYKFNINEVVSSIMLNYIVEYIVSFFIVTRFVDPISRQSRPVSDASRLTLSEIKISGIKYDIPLGFIVAVAASLLLAFILDKTVLGYDLKAVGANRRASGYAGIHVSKNILTAMLISGILAGLAGVTYYMGYVATIEPKTLSDVGFNAIAVSILGNNSPGGIFLASIVIQIIDKGATYMSSQQTLEVEIASVITSVILLSSACGLFYGEIGEKLRNARTAARKQHRGKEAAQ
ncbi:MAG: ABC transporter permease [Lachnospiraceae bacterium]|jgi:ABC-type uncharacterized transport system permease subunit|nr:ABC transporter permease [Lachnospiraceae bacterium]